MDKYQDFEHFTRWNSMLKGFLKMEISIKSSIYLVSSSLHGRRSILKAEHARLSGQVTYIQTFCLLVKQICYMYFLLFTHLFKSRTIKLIKPRFEVAYSTNLQARALPNELSQRNYRVSWRDALLTACLNCYQPASVQIQSIKLDFMLTIRC
jgi:hypothetical protein